MPTTANAPTVPTGAVIRYPGDIAQIFPTDPRTGVLHIIGVSPRATGRAYLVVDDALVSCTAGEARCLAALLTDCADVLDSRDNTSQTAGA